MYQIKTKLGEGGQIVIPPEFLQALGFRGWRYGNSKPGKWRGEHIYIANCYKKSAGVSK